MAWACDQRLIDLTAFGPDATLAALIIARAQATTFENRGHLLALNDEYVWRRLKGAGKGKGYRHIGVRCILCFATAPLGWWIDYAHVPADKAPEIILPGMAGMESPATLFVEACRSHSKAERLISALAGQEEPYAAVGR